MQGTGYCTANAHTTDLSAEVQLPLSDQDFGLDQP